MDQPIYKNSPPLSGDPPDSKKIILNRWAEFLTDRKITPSDIDYTVEKSIEEGEKEDSAKITELKEVRQALVEFQQTLPSEEQEKFEQERVIETQKGSPSVQLPSVFNTTIYRAVSLPSSSQTTIPGRQIFSSIRTRVFGPPVGQGVKTAVQGVGQKSRQAVGSTLTKGTAAVLTKTGLHTVAAAVTGGIGNIVVFVAPKLLKIGSSLAKNTVSWVSSGFGLFTDFTEGLTGQRETPENKDLKFLLPVFGGLILVVFFLPIFLTITTGGAFIQSGSGGPGEEFQLPPGVEPNCPNPRHLAEKVICVLSTGDSPCNHTIVDENSWDDVSSCLGSSSIPGKDAIGAAFQRFLISIDGGKRNLQCVGFVVGIEAGLGRSIEKAGNARDYLKSPFPAGYKLVKNRSDVKVGDAAVWQGNTYGHIAIVIEVVKDTEGVPVKIVTAESDGYTGMIAIREEIPVYSPSGFLTYTQ